MRTLTLPAAGLLALLLLCACGDGPAPPAAVPAPEPTAADLLGDPAYRAMSYGGYRTVSRDTQPTNDQLKQDLRLLHAAGVRLLRTYNVHLPQAANLLAAIRELRAEDADFRMYVMLGAWIDAYNAWTGQPVDHARESERNATEIARAVELANQYPEVVKMIAVGNEAMVKWAAAYYVEPDIVLRWVRHLQGLKTAGELGADVWITSSDNFAAWGGGGPEYHVPALDSLIAAVDFLSVHVYPMHDTHYNPAFWGVRPEEQELPKTEQIARAMDRALVYAQDQYRAVAAYAAERNQGNKPIHVGETGWASVSSDFYGPDGSRACDEYKQGLYHERMRAWTDNEGISCFYFEGFDEPWKDPANAGGSENHFGLFTVDGRAKFAIWDLVDAGVFDGLNRGEGPVTKTYGGDTTALLETVVVPAVRAGMK